MKIEQAFAFKKKVKSFEIEESIEVVTQSKSIDIKKKYKYGHISGVHIMDMSIETAKKLRDSLILILERLDKFNKDV